jgi:hypothetical protein
MSPISPNTTNVKGFSKIDPIPNSDSNGDPNDIKRGKSENAIRITKQQPEPAILLIILRVIHFGSIDPS